MSKEAALAYIDMLEPEHMRTSCSGTETWNAAFQLEKGGPVYNNCNRCSLIRIAELALGEAQLHEPDSDA